jgi:hypothetical protein
VGGRSRGTGRRVLLCSSLPVKNAAFVQISIRARIANFICVGIGAMVPPPSRLTTGQHCLRAMPLTVTYSVDLRSR